MSRSQFRAALVDGAIVGLATIGGLWVINLILTHGAEIRTMLGGTP